VVKVLWLKINKDLTNVMISHWSMDIAPANGYQFGLSLFWPTSQIFSAECKCSAAPCVTAY